MLFLRICAAHVGWHTPRPSLSVCTVFTDGVSYTSFHTKDIYFALNTMALILVTVLLRGMGVPILML